MTPRHRTVLASLLLLITGCTTPTVVDYLTLSTLQQTVVREDAAAISVGPVTLPDYLKRNGLARRDSSGALHYSANELWAEPLDRGIQRTLIESLSDALGDTAVVEFPDLTAIAPRYRVTVSLRELSATPTAVELTAVWRILPASTSAAEPVQSARFRGERTLASPSGPAIAEAFSELVGDLARDIARAIPAQPG